MRKYILTAAFMFSVAILLTAPHAYSAEKADHDCAKCHQINNDEALKMLKDEIGVPEAKIIEVRPGPIKGLWEIAFESRGQKGIMYVDFSKKQVILGNIFNLKTKTNLTGERLYNLNKVDISQIPLNEALVMGDKNAPQKVVVFTDPE